MQGQDPDEFIRKAHVTGKISLRSPETIAEAARGMQFFPDKGVGFAATGVLAGAFREETETYVKAAGIAMSAQASDDFKKSLKRRGMLGADPMTILRGLQAEGVDTTDELAKLGLGEIRQVHAMNTLLNNMPAVERYLTEIPRLAADRNLLARERAGVEAELPTTQITREIGMLEAGQMTGKTLDPLAEEKLREDRELLIRGTALRRMGFETKWGIDLIDERGRAKTGPLAWFGRTVAHLEGPSTMIPPARGETRPSDQFERLIESIGKELATAAKNLNEAARTMHGGPALVPATVDR